MLQQNISCYSPVLQERVQSIRNVTAQAGHSTPLPPMLGGVSVTVARLPAALSYVSPAQLNALVPSTVAIPPNTVVTLALTSTSGSGSYGIRLTREAPAIFSQDGS